MKKLFTFFLASFVSIGTIVASTLVDGIWYVFDNSTLTAKVADNSIRRYNYSGEVIIPSSVTYDGATYTVTKISDAGFYGCRNMTSIEIPNSVTAINGQSFCSCTGLKYIFCRATNPPVCNTDYTFQAVPNSIPIYVPKGTINSYKNAMAWKGFKNYQTSTENQSACSHTKMAITIIHTSPTRRWERSYNGGASWTNIACTSYQYTESNPTAGIAQYRVLGTNGTYSDVVTITYIDAVPSTIQTLPATNTKTVDESITLTADVTDNGYTYQWKKDGTDISGAKSRTYTISKLKSSHAGNYTCYVSNGCNGITTTTAKLTVNKCAQVIDFPEIPVQTYSSGLTYTLPKTTNKGLTITYQSMNTSVATVSGNVLTIKAPGTAIIAATQVGNADYLEATQVSRTLTVNKRSQVITFGELPEKTYEDLPFTLPQKTNEGLTISYTSSNTSVATVSGNTVTILKPGSTDIIASQAGDATHYAATQVSQTLIVKKAAQEITFGALSSKTYGDAPFNLNKVSNKNLNITYTSSDASIASIAGNVVTINHPGTVTITASQAGNAYYLAAESVSQTLTVNKANQSINFPALESRAYASGDFDLAAQTDKGETITYTSSNPSVATVSGNTVHITGAGTTDITAEQAGNEYYNAAPTVSQTLTITKAYQTITFPELPTCTYGQAPITLNATVNSDLEVEYESSDYSVATINGNELTIVGAGQCYITASVAGNKNYYTATPVERTLIVNKADQTITFAPLESEYTYGDAPIALVANGATFTSSNPEKLFIMGNNAIINGAGTFTITAALAEDANHLAASVSQTITVQKAPLTLTANNVSRLYGEANPAFTYAFKGFVNGDTKLDLTAAIEVTSNAILTSPVGNYEIVPTASVDANYAITCKKGVLTIDKAPLTVSAQATREYGEFNPEFEFIYSGFKNDETTAVLTAAPQAYSTAKRTSSAGTYPIYVSGGDAQNYAFSYAEGTLTVTKAPLTIRALDATRKRAEENPQFQLSFTGFKLDETEEVLDRLPTIRCEADINSPVGTYPIVLLNDGFATNYEYILINGTLTVEIWRYTIDVLSEDNTKGLVAGGGTYDEETSVQISATPQPGYHFSCWNDGVTDNPRTIIASEDITYTALFAADVPTEEETVRVTTTDNGATISTGTINDEAVDSYRLAICHNGDTICVLSLDTEGRLTGIDFRSAPSRMPQQQDQVTSSGLNIPVTGLQPGTTYHYTLDALDVHQNILERREGDFTTTNTNAVDNVFMDDSPVRKVIIDNVIYILRGDRIYTLQGQEVK